MRTLKKGENKLESAKNKFLRRRLGAHLNSEFLVGQRLYPLPRESRADKVGLTIRQMNKISFIHFLWTKSVLDTWEILKSDIRPRDSKKRKIQQ